MLAYAVINYGYHITLNLKMSLMDLTCATNRSTLTAIKAVFYRILVCNIAMQ